MLGRDRGFDREVIMDLDAGETLEALVEVRALPPASVLMLQRNRLIAPVEARLDPGMGEQEESQERLEALRLGSVDEPARLVDDKPSEARALVRGSAIMRQRKGAKERIRRPLDARLRRARPARPPGPGGPAEWPQ
ncbi:MAG: hypothetical protein AAF645_02780 [Myxococcota bacterium]